MLFSVIIPAYKMGRYIGEALDSVVAQNYQDWEIIVVDDCAPDDGTANIVQAFAAKHPDHRVEFIRHEVNTGVSGARNTAIKNSQGDVLAFLDPDDLWLCDYLAKMSERFETEPEADAISSPPIAFIEITGKPNPWTDVIRFENWQMMQFPASLAVGNFLQPSSTVVRKSWIEKIGGFDTQRDLQHIEDYDLWIRLAQAGARFSFINQNLTKYRKHAEAATSDTRRMEELHERLVTKHTVFFVNAQRQMLWVVMRDVRAVRKSLKSPFRTLIDKFLKR